MVEELKSMEEKLVQHVGGLSLGMIFHVSFEENFDCGDENLKKIVEPFIANAGLLKTFLNAVAKWYPAHDTKNLLEQVMEFLYKALKSLERLDRELVYDWHGRQEKILSDWKEASLEVCSFIVQIDDVVKQVAEEVLQLPKSQLSNTLMPHQNLAVFIDFLRSVLEELLQSTKHVYQDMDMDASAYSQEIDPFKNISMAKLQVKIQPIASEIERIADLRDGLCFLLTFLCDTPLQNPMFDKVKDLWIHIETVAQSAGKIVFLILTSKTGMEISQDLSHSLQNIQPIQSEIKQYLDAFQPRMPNSMRSDEFIFRFTSSITEHLRDLLEYKADSMLPLKTEIEMAEKELTSLGSSVTNIEKRLAEHEEYWKDLISSIANVVDITEHLVSSFEVEGGPVWYYKRRLSHVLDEIKLVKQKMDEIEEKTKCDLGIQQAAAEMSAVSLQDNTSPSTKIMIDSAYETNIKEQLLGGEANLQLISIVGMPGLGKTTLARKLFEHPLILSKFYPRGWCRVSRTHDTRNLLLSILASMDKLDDEVRKMKEEDLASLLYRKLIGNRYLLVVDDIWSTKAWDDCRPYFPDSLGSRIIFTSRMENLQLEGRPHTAYKLPFLSPKDCWFLLRHNAFEKGVCPSELENVGKIIATRCQGLPLAINLIAGLLRTMERKLSVWEQVSESLSSYIAGEKIMGEKILEEIYKHLPDHLKACLMYSASFRELKEIKVKKLIQLWVAEGLIQKTGEETLEKTAEDYLMDLINRSLVIVVDRKANGSVKTCVIHSLLNDFFLRKANETKFLKAIDTTFDIYESHDRLAVIDPICLSFVKSFGPRVRSLLGLFSYSHNNLLGDVLYLISSLKLLKVLDLESVDLPTNLMMDLSQLILLKYLAIRGDFLSIPSWIGNLWNIETLIVNGRLKCIPDAVLGMIKLKRLLVNGEENSAVNLEPLHGQQARKLHNLQTLATVYIKCLEDEKVFWCFPAVKKLKCVFAKVQTTTGFRLPELHFLSNLETLHVSFMGKRKYDPQVSSPKPTIETFPLSLKQLTLSSFVLPWEIMSVLGESLPNLEVLKLESNAFSGEEWDVDTDEVVFPKLTFLKLQNLDIHSWISTSTCDAFPKLERLVLRWCGNLTEIPFSFADNPNFCLIELQGCRTSAEDSAKQIKMEKHEYGHEEFQVLIQAS